MLNARPVQLFYYVVRYGGVTEAAKHIRPRISQSTLSEVINELEETVDAVLYYRRPLSLTPAGQVLYEFAKNFCGGLDEVAERLRNGAPDMIRIGAWSVVLKDYLPVMLRTLEVQFPKFRVYFPFNRPHNCPERHRWYHIGLPEYPAQRRALLHGLLRNHTLLEPGAVDSIRDIARLIRCHELKQLRARTNELNPAAA